MWMKLHHILILTTAINFLINKLNNAPASLQLMTCRSNLLRYAVFEKNICECMIYITTKVVHR